MGREELMLMEVNELTMLAVSDETVRGFREL